MSVHDVIRASLLRRAGLFDVARRTVAELRQTEWVPRFEQLMRNRLIVGAYRYATFEEKRRGVKRYDVVGSAIQRLRAYQNDGNLEHLVDVANLCMMEFDHPVCHQSPRFIATDDVPDASRVREIA